MNYKSIVTTMRRKKEDENAGFEINNIFVKQLEDFLVHIELVKIYF